MGTVDRSPFLELSDKLLKRQMCFGRALSILGTVLKLDVQCIEDVSNGNALHVSNIKGLTKFNPSYTLSLVIHCFLVWLVPQTPKSHLTCEFCDPDPATWPLGRHCAGFRDCPRGGSSAACTVLETALDPRKVSRTQPARRLWHTHDALLTFSGEL